MSIGTSTVIDRTYLDRLLGKDKSAGPLGQSCCDVCFVGTYNSKKLSCVDTNNNYMSYTDTCQFSWRTWAFIHVCYRSITQLRSAWEA